MAVELHHGDGTVKVMLRVACTAQLTLLLGVRCNACGREPVLLVSRALL
jgi:hypothetical protein